MPSRRASRSSSRSSVRLTRDGTTVAADDGPARGLRRRAGSGSLYERIVERLVKPDTARQAPGLSHAYHPWYPVLLIGSHKAELYTRALVGDIVDKRRHLADPAGSCASGSTSSC